MIEPKAALGQRLKAAREKKGLSTQKAADELHLDGWVVDALEGGDYVRIGPAVYAKGHLKRYAALLGLPAAEIIDAYDAQAATPAPGQTAGLRSGMSSSTGSEAPWAQMVGLAIVAVIVAGVVWWKPWNLWLSNGPGTPPPASTRASAAAPAGAPAGSADAAPAGAAPAGAGPAGAGPASGEKVAEDTGPEAEADAGAPELAAAPTTRAAPMARAAPTASALPTANAAPTASAASVASVPAMRVAAAAAKEKGSGAAGAGHARLRLSFSADAWVDVHDATGQRLYAGDGRANSVKTLSGEAPLRVYLKSAGGVQLQINDRAVAIGQQFVSGDSARFEAGADGVLRRESRPPAEASPMAKVASPHG